MPFVFTPAPVVKSVSSLERISAPVSRALQRQLMRELTSLRRSVSLSALTAAAGSGNGTRAVKATKVDQVGRFVGALWRGKELRGALVTGAKHGLKDAPLRERVTFAPVFKALDPSEEWVKLVLAWITEHGAELVKQINGTSAAAVRAMLLEGVRAGRHPRAIAKDIQQIVGLTEPQSIAVARRRQVLLESGMPPARVERITARYAEQLLRQRAQIIAENEVHVAMNRGRIGLWRQLQEEGGFEPDIEREWITAVDEAVCPICGPMHGQKTSIGGTYRTKAGVEIDHPPAHVRCRCTEALT